MPRAPKPQSASYRLRCSYATPTTARDRLGQPIPTFNTVYASLRCNLRTPNGREFAAASLMQATISHVVEHRYPGAIPSPRGRYTLEDGRILEIVSAVDPDGRRERIVASCVETT